jgi:diphthamide synthase subunit DPH2
MITDKVYDRAIVLNFKKREDSFKVARTVPIHLSNAEFQALLAKSTRVTQDNIKEIQNIVVSASKDDVVQIGCPSGILS